MLARDLKPGDVVEDKECKATWVLLGVRPHDKALTLTWLRLDDHLGVATPSDQEVSLWHDYGRLIRLLAKAPR